MSGGEGYSGTDSYKYIEPLLRERGSRLIVVSPYIGADYARLIVREAGKKSVYVLTSEASRSASQEEALRILRGAERLSRRYVAIMAYLSLLLAASLVIHSYYLALLVASVMMAFSVVLLSTSRSHGRYLHLKIAGPNFVHEKLYISDTKAIVGSANLTYSGLHRNVEHIEIIRDGARRRELIAHFESLWRE